MAKWKRVTKKICGYSVENVPDCEDSKIYLKAKIERNCKTLVACRLARYVETGKEASTLRILLGLTSDKMATLLGLTEREWLNYERTKFLPVAFKVALRALAQEKLTLLRRSFSYLKGNQRNMSSIKIRYGSRR